MASKRAREDSPSVEGNEGCHLVIGNFNDGFESIDKAIVCLPEGTGNVLTYKMSLHESITINAQKTQNLPTLRAVVGEKYVTLYECCSVAPVSLNIKIDNTEDPESFLLTLRTLVDESKKYLNVGKVFTNYSGGEKSISYEFTLVGAVSLNLRFLLECLKIMQSKKLDFMPQSCTISCGKLVFF